MIEISWRRSLIALVATTALVANAKPSGAEIIWTGNVEPVDPTTWTNTSFQTGTDAYVGRTANGTLTVSRDQLHSRYGFVGYEAGVAGEVTLDGIGSTWGNTASLYVGYYGNGIVNIAGGGTVDTDHHYDVWLGYHSGSSGLVTVDGLGSMWTTGDYFYVGYGGSGTLSISNGGSVSSDYGDIGRNSGSTGLVTVDGVGSTWANDRSMRIGYSGSGTLGIANGGSVSSDYSVIGLNSESTGLVTVDGAGSTWENDRSVHIGYSGSGSLNITGGAAVNSSSGYIGYETGSTGRVTINGTGSTWTSESSVFVGDYGSSVLDISGGGAVFVERETWVARYPSSSGAIYFDNGTLTTGDILCAADDLTGTGTIYTNGLVSDVDLVFDATHGLDRTLTINDDVTVFLSVDGSHSIGAGYGGTGSMSISEGFILESTTGYIGYKPGSLGVVAVEGPGSTWENERELDVGGYGNGELVVENGAYVSVGQNTWVSRYRGSSGEIHFDNGALATGGLLCAATDLTGSGLVSANGLVSDIDLVFDATHGLERTININDNITLNLSIDGLSPMGAGYRGTGTMRISDGFVLESSTGYIGYQSGSVGLVTVDGIGSKWGRDRGSKCPPNDLYIGYYGNGMLNITAGGTVSNDDGYIGYESGSTGFVSVHGTGSTMTNSTRLYVGHEGVGILNITDGGMVSSRISSISESTGSTGLVSVDGVGSTWANESSLYVGNFGNGVLRITSGGAVVNSSSSSVGGYIGSTGVVTVEGAGSRWTNSYGLTIGSMGSGILNVINGGTVSSHSCRIGNGVGSMGQVTVRGAGSTWTDDYFVLHIGHDGSGILSITEGGTVSNGTVYFAFGIGSSGVATVDGVGSTWINNGHIYLGSRGSGSLNVTNSGLVTVAGNTRLGGNPGSSGTIYFDNGTLTTTGLLCAADDLTGSGKIYTNGLVSDIDLVFDAAHGTDQTFRINEDVILSLNIDGSGPLGVGYGGSATMRISDGIVVASTDGYVGYQTGVTSEVTVSGPGSTWANSRFLDFGYYTGSGGMLNISNGGLVSVGDRLRIDGSGDDVSFINMSTAGKLALLGDADDSLADFLGLISDTDAIRYWDNNIADWAPLTSATYDVDYKLQYLISGNLAGYTLLTVGLIPEPSALLLGCFALASVCALSRCK